MAKQREPRTALQHIAPPQAERPVLSNVPQFLLLELEVEREYRPQMLAALEEKVNEVVERSRACVPACPDCGRSMRHHDTRRVSWIARFGRVVAWVPRYRCGQCGHERRPVLEQLGVEPGRISGSLARLLALLAVVAPYPLAAQLAWLLLGVKISPMGVWRVAQRMGEAAASYSEGLSKYHSDSRSDPTLAQAAPGVVVLGVDGCVLGMQVRKGRRRLQSEGAPEPLPAVETGHFREVKTGVLLLPSERVETSPGRRSVVRRFLVSCLGDADTVFSLLWARLRELGWLGTHTVVVIIGDGAEWIWKRAAMFPQRCEILDFWHADADGQYDLKAFRCRGHQFSDANGRYALETIVPGLYPGRTRHYHVRLQAAHGPTPCTQLYFPGEARNASDSLFRPDLLLKIRETNSVRLATFNFVLERA